MLANEINQVRVVCGTRDAKYYLEFILLLFSLKYDESP